MKNKKNLILTIVVIALFSAAIIAGSGIFSNYIGSENETENNLTAETIEENIASSFDYPYFKMQDIEANRAYESYAVYKNNLISSLNLFFIKDKLEFEEALARQPLPDENMLTYQQVANIGGEAIKYLYGITYHTNEPAMVWYIDREDGDKCFWYTFSDGKVPENGNNYNKSMRYINVNIDAYTGKIKSISKSYYYPINVKLDSGIDYPYGLEFTDELKEKVLTQLTADLQTLGFEGRPTPYLYQVKSNKGFNSYIIYFDMPDGVKRYCAYMTSDNELFELQQISKRAV